MKELQFIIGIHVMRNNIYHIWILKKYRFREIYVEDRAESCVHHIESIVVEYVLNKYQDSNYNV